MNKSIYINVDWTKPTFVYNDQGAEVKVIVNGNVSYYQVKVLGFYSNFDQFNSRLVGNFAIVNN